MHRHHSKAAMGAAGIALLALLAGCGAPGSAGGGGSESPEEQTGNGPYNLEIAENPEFDEGTTMS